MEHLNCHFLELPFLAHSSKKMYCDAGVTLPRLPPVRGHEHGPPHEGAVAKLKKERTDYVRNYTRRNLPLSR
jgi:hypothetical protein